MADKPFAPHLRENEAAFDKAILAYITGSSDTEFHGLVNLLTTIETICDKLSEQGGKGWDEAAQILSNATTRLDYIKLTLPDNV
jgi:hypothetical protein